MCVSGSHSENEKGKAHDKCVDNVRRSNLDAVLQEYDDLRGEIKLRIEERTTVLGWYIVGLSAIAGYAIQSQNYILMIVAAPYALCWLIAMSSSYFYSDSLAHYIREEIEQKKIPHLIGIPQALSYVDNKKPTYPWQTRWLGWETNFELNLREKNPFPRSMIMRAFGPGAFSVSAVCLIIGLVQLRAELTLSLAAGIIWGIGWIGVGELVIRKQFPGKRKGVSA